MRFLLSRWLCVVALAAAAPWSVRADDSAMNEGAYGPEPRGGTAGEESIIRMESEQITVKFGRDHSDVVARFVFRSYKPKEPARQLVGFPDYGAANEEVERRDPQNKKGWDGNLNTTGPLRDLHTLVDGKEVESKLDYGFVKISEDAGWTPGTPQDGVLMAWHTMWVEFPPDKDVVVERRYTANNGSMVGGIEMFEYITATGASWRGTIGQMDVDVTLDGWTADDIAWKTGGKKKQIFESGPFTSPEKKAWKILSPTHLQFTWKNFEPRTDKDRRSFGLVMVGTNKEVISGD